MTNSKQLLDNLQRNTICGISYLVWMYPKTQSEVVKIIYNVDDARKANQEPIINCRMELIRAGYLEDIDKDRIKNKRFMSAAKAYLDYLEESLRERKSRIKINEKDLYMIQCWFREIYKPEYMLRDDDYPMLAKLGLHREKGRLSIQNAIYQIASTLNELATLSFVFEEHLRERGIKIERPTIDEIIEVGNFDKVARELPAQIEPNELLEMYLKLFLDGLTPFTFVELNRNVLLIPKSVAELFRLAGRPAHTLDLQGLKSLSEELSEKLEGMGIYEDVVNLAGSEEEFLKDPGRYTWKYLKSKIEIGML